MQIRFKNIALSSHFAVVSSFVHKRSMNTYPKCDTPPSRSARHSLAPLQKSRRKSPFLLVCYTAVFSVVTQRSSPLTSGEERCVTTLTTAV